MKMRARKRYHDSWQVGRELFRLNQRLRASWARELRAFPADFDRRDDLMDAMQYMHAQINSTMGIPAAAYEIGPGWRERRAEGNDPLFEVPRHLLRDQGKSRIQYWAIGNGKQVHACQPPDTVWLDEACPARVH